MSCGNNFNNFPGEQIGHATFVHKVT